MSAFIADMGRIKMQNDGMVRRARSAAVALVSGIALGLGVLPAALAADTPDTLAGVKIVSAEEALKMAGRGVPLIDTRVATEYADKTIKGAKSVPYREKSAKEVKF